METMSPDDHVEAILALLADLPRGRRDGIASVLYAGLYYRHSSELRWFTDSVVWQVVDEVADRLSAEVGVTPD